MRAAPAGASKVLVLSVVHPDYLPSLYAVSTVLERHGYTAHVFSFASPASGSALWGTLNLHVCGEQRGGPLGRWRARSALVGAARAWQQREHPIAIVATCPFTLAAALDLSAQTLPVAYLSYETYEVRPGEMLRSPLSWLRSRKGFRIARKADLICVPSQERAGWLLARAALDRTPVTVLNCPPLAHHSPAMVVEESETVRHLADRFVVIHTGRVSHAQAILELVESVRLWPAGSGLVITNVGASPYEEAVRSLASRSERRDDIVLLPAVSRADMLALQHRARVGIFLARDTSALETLMPAPNKVGEYVHAGLLTVARRSAFMETLEHHSVAVLTESLEPACIAASVERALKVTRDGAQRVHCRRIARDWYNMDVQARPIVRFLDNSARRPRIE